MNLKRLLLTSLITLGACFSPAWAGTHFGSLATLAPAHHLGHPIIARFDLNTDALIIGVVLSVLVLGMWFGKCYGNGHRD